MNRAIGFMALSVVMASAFAMATFGAVFNSKYGIKPGSGLAKMKCGVCHGSPGGGKLNPYGKDMQAAMKAKKTKKLTPAILAAIEAKDSDKDGKKNLAEIKAGTNPGK